MTTIEASEVIRANVPKHLMIAAAKACSKEKTRYALQNFRLTSEHVEATDGKILVRFPIGKKINLDQSQLISGRDVLDSRAAKVQTTIVNQDESECGAPFPNIDAVIPEKRSHYVAFGVKLLKKLLDSMETAGVQTIALQPGEPDRSQNCAWRVDGRDSNGFRCVGVIMPHEWEA